MSERKIEPALTPEEWASRKVILLREMDPGTVVLKEEQAPEFIGPVVKMSIVTGSPAHSVHVHLARRRGVGPAALKTIAAFCLVDMEFGFSREDVAMLRIAADVVGTYGTGQPEIRAENAATFNHLADRIEALLPPGDA